MKELPIKYCYWVTDKLLAGEYPRNADEESSAAKVGALLGAGVSVFIDLTEESENSAFVQGESLLPYSDLAESARHLRFAIPDMGVPRSREFTKDILDAIDQYIEEGHTVYLHCLGGVGRTGTIVGCWLARHGYRGDSALEHLGELWLQNPKSRNRDTPERKKQVEYIREWLEPDKRPG